MRADGGTTKMPEEVAVELEKAIAKFPTWPTDPFHALAVVLEELGELAKATLHKTYEPHIYEEGEIEKEAVQTAAMGARFVRSLMRYRYLKSEQHSQEAAQLAAAPSPSVNSDEEGGKR